MCVSDNASTTSPAFQYQYPLLIGVRWSNQHSWAPLPFRRLLYPRGTAPAVARARALELELEDSLVVSSKNVTYCKRLRVHVTRPPFSAALYLQLP